jgi:aminoglycoside phosphotransferase (APT) family kinase protein
VTPARALHAPPDPPPASVLRWAERSVGRGWRVVDVRRLTGGIATATHELVLERSGGRRVRVVLRRPHRRWAAEDPLGIVREARTLEHVRAHAPADVVPVPEVVAVCGPEDGGASPDRGALLTRKRPGRIDLAPSDPSAWLQRQAEALTAIHVLPSLPGRPAWGSAAGIDLSDRTPPPWSKHPEVWASALARFATASRPRDVDVFCHGDFQHFNFLWVRGRLAAVVDWGASSLSHPDRDTGHCRLNLVILYGSAVAEDFRRRYEAASGRAVDPWWDLVETLVFLPSWSDTIRRQVRGRIPVRVADIHRRVDAHLPLLLERLG